MNRESRRIALCGVMVALGAAVMLLGGVIPLATFCCPALAGFALCAAGLYPPARWAARTLANMFRRIFVKIGEYRWIKVIFR